MADKLTDMFNEWAGKNPEGTTHQAFQAGVTAGAVSMRTRAMNAIDQGHCPNNEKNTIKNAIGQLSDIG
jgi:hypothetical protein